MNNNNEEERGLSLVMNSGVIPSPDGVSYMIRDGYCDNVWVWEVSSSDDWGESFYILSDYPNDNIFDHVKYMYRDYDWFDPEEFDEMLKDGYDVNMVQIYYENNYKLPYQALTIRNGHIYAYDEEMKVERELCRMRLACQDDDGNWNEFSFMMLVRERPVIYNRAMIMSLLNSYDSKVPKNQIELMNKFHSWLQNGNDYEFKIEDVFVLDGR